ncbi:hypothetical protein SAMN05428949_1716 [Chitinophaga sp. YR627]|nr:hypothetical protein SAMN05428949_1716 [Chitinophaga sp. YR627]
MSGIGLRNMMNDRNNVPTANYRDSRLRMRGHSIEVAVTQFSHLFTVNLTIKAI